jgi:hypothetical protein
LPPEAESEHDVKIEGWVDNYYNIGPGSYVFLKTTDLANQSYRGFIVSSQDDLNVISRTKNVTNIYYGQGGVVNNGPDYDRLVQDANVRIDRYKLNYVQQNNPETQFSETTRGDQLQVVAPAAHLQRAATVQPKIAGNIANAQVDRGWQNIDEARARQLKQTWEKQAPVPASLPAKPAPPKPLFARAAGQSQAASQQPAAENREPNPPSATPQSNQGRNDENVAPTPSPNEKAAQPGQQPPTPNENRRQEPNQGKRSETTPPASSPSENERSIRQPERSETSPNKNRREEQGEGERAQPAANRAESPPSKNERPTQSEEKRGGGENLDQKAPGTAGGTEEKGGMPPKEEKTTRQLKKGDETPAKGEERQREGSQNPSKSNVEETERPTSGDKREQSRDQSGEEKPGGKKRSDEPEKKKVGPSQQ